jgi:hypothetical protein
VNLFKFHKKNINLNDFIVPLWAFDNEKIKTNCFVDRPTYDSQKKQKINYLSDDPSTYYLNNYGFRSDDFTDKHNGKHILFAGCSNTFGVGMPQDYLWPTLVYEKIKEKESLSGFYNLGIPAGSNFEIISNIFKYCKMFGNPDCIFINFPNIGRDVIYLHDDAQQNHQTNYLATILSHNVYLMLEQYCNSNNIKLISFTWTQFLLNRYTLIKNKNIVDLYKNKSDEKLYNYFKTFYQIDEKKFFNDIFTCIDQNKDLDCLIDAYDKRDDQEPHFGYAFHYAWSEFAHSLYMIK